MKAFHFVVLAALAGCATETLPTYEARVEYVVRLPEALSEPGAQVKIVPPGSAAPILVWRTPIGFGATSIRCHCCDRDVRYNAEKGTIDCPRGSRFSLHGEILDGKAKWPLKSYDVDLQGNSLKILG